MAKTSTQRVQEFRARQKEKKRLEGEYGQRGGIRIGAGRPKGMRTSADRSRDYRQRLKERRHCFELIYALGDDINNSQ